MICRETAANQNHYASGRSVVKITSPVGLRFLSDHILPIEDPIEFVHESKKSLVNQREVHRDTLGFNEALRSALREDPDIILVG